MGRAERFDPSCFRESLAAPADEDPDRARLEALAQWARDLPELDAEEAERGLVEAAGGEDAAREVLRRVTEDVDTG